MLGIMNGEVVNKSAYEIVYEGVLKLREEIAELEKTNDPSVRDTLSFKKENLEYLNQIRYNVC